MKTINKNLTLTNFNKRGTNPIWIVLHYTANDGDTAYNNTEYFKNTYRGASANYFVDENSIWQCVSDTDTAWHVGNDTYKNACRNTNSIGIEMCSRRKSGASANDLSAYYLKDETVANAVELTKYLMDKYNIPISRVCRHYDVTGKYCPAPFVYNNGTITWDNFKSKLTTEEIDMTKAEVQAMIQTEAAIVAKDQIKNHFATMAGTKCPAWAKEYMQEAIARGIVSGDGKSQPTPDNVRPESYIKRDEAAKMILEAEKIR